MYAVISIIFKLDILDKKITFIPGISIEHVISSNKKHSKLKYLNL